MFVVYLCDLKATTRLLLLNNHKICNLGQNLNTKSNIEVLRKKPFLQNVDVQTIAADRV